MPQQLTGYALKRRAGLVPYRYDNTGRRSLPLICANDAEHNAALNEAALRAQEANKWREPIVARRYHEIWDAEQGRRVLRLGTETYGYGRED